METVGRLPHYLRLAVRGAARPDKAAPRARCRRAESDSALGPQRDRGLGCDRPAVRRRRSRRQARRPLGRLRRQPKHDRPGGRCQARCVPVDAAAATGCVPAAGQLAGRLPGCGLQRRFSERLKGYRMESYDLAIIGTGSGNSILDDRYAKKRVAICEQGTFGGTCLNVGCIPTKMFVYAAKVAETIRSAARYGIDAHIDRVRWDDIVSRVFGRIDPIAIGGEDYRRAQPNVDVYATHTRFAAVQDDGRYLLRTDDDEEFTAEQVVIAAGARAEIPPAILDCGVHYYTSDDIMRIPELPKHLVIVGGGFVACEFAHIFSALGVRITMVIRGGSLLRHLDDTLSRRFTRIAASKWEVRSHRNILGSHENRSGIVLELNDGSELTADAVLVATGRRSNGDRLDADTAGIELDDRRIVVDEYQRTSARNVFALGDVSSPYELKHVANHEARVVQRNLLCNWDDTKAMVATDHRYVPAAVFTDPQIAYIGLTENEAVAKGFDVSCKIQDYADVAYGWATEDTVGIVKLISDSKTGQLLGAHIMGHQAASIIQPLIQAMTFGLSVHEMARGQYWIHPALPEVVENALLGLSD